MKHRRLGRTGLKVSEIRLGTMTFAGQCDETTALQILDAAADRGVTFLDTADAYPIPPDPRPPAGPKPSSAAGSRATAAATSLCWRPSAGSASATGPTTRGCRDATSWPPVQPAPAPDRVHRPLPGPLFDAETPLDEPSAPSRT